MGMFKINLRYSVKCVDLIIKMGVIQSQSQLLLTFVARLKQSQQVKIKACG